MGFNPGGYQFNPQFNQNGGGRFAQPFPMQQYMPMETEGRAPKRRNPPKYKSTAIIPHTVAANSLPEFKFIEMAPVHFKVIEPTYKTQIQGVVDSVGYIEAVTHVGKEVRPHSLIIRTGDGKIEKYYISTYIPKGKVAEITVGNKQMTKGMPGFRPQHRLALRNIRPGDQVHLSVVVGKNSNSRFRSVNQFDSQQSKPGNIKGAFEDSKAVIEKQFMTMPVNSYFNRIMAVELESKQVLLFKNRTGMSPNPGSYFKVGMMKDLVLLTHPYNDLYQGAPSAVSDISSTA